MLQNELELVETHLYLVKKIICSTIYYNESVQGLGYEDLFQTGCEALCHAALHYRSDRGASFETFANKVIQNQLYSHCRKINHIQAKLLYLDEPLKDSFGLTYADIIIDEKELYMASDKEIILLLTDAGKQYTGITRKGIDALILKCNGYCNQEIALQYQTKPNHIAAWISRACYKLKSDKHFTCLQH